MKHAHLIHKQHKFSWVQVCWLVAAAVLLLGGVFSLITHDNIVYAARPLGMAMLAAGLINLFICIKKSHEIHGSRWLIADGICAVLLSIFPLFNQMSTPVLIPFFFGMWEFFSGVLKVMDGVELKEEHMHPWQAISFIGWVELVSGTASLIKPLDDLVGINKVIAVIFLVQSVGFIFKAILYKYLTE
ncbi:MAG: DUF308 domain-containing protein [Clostridia bacterium]|nr:DUF308 domain-containing protein [Clostridia bacterium]